MSREIRWTISLRNLLKGGLDTAARQVRGFERAVRGAADSIRSGFGRIASSILSMKGLLVGAGIAGAVRAFGETIRQAFKVETALTQLKVLTGSMDKAKAVFKDLKAFSDATPFEFGEVAQAGRMLLAFGTSAEDLLPTLQRIGDVASAVGMSFVELAEIYGKNKVQGRLMAVDINQLTGRGIPIIRELAKQYGVSEDKVRGLVESGQVGFAAMEQAFISLTSSGGQFYGMMRELSTTGDGLISTLKGEWVGALADFGGEFMALAKDGIQGAIDRLKKLRDDGTIREWAAAAAEKIKLVKDALLSIGSGDTTTIKLSVDVLKAGAMAAFVAAGGYLLKLAPIIGELIGKAAFRIMGTERGRAMADVRQQMVDEGLLTKSGPFGGLGPEAERRGLSKDQIRQMIEDRTDEVMRSRGAAEAAALAPSGDASGLDAAVQALRDYLASQQQPETPSPRPAPPAPPGIAPPAAEDDSAAYQAQVEYEAAQRRREYDKADQKRKEEMLAEDERNLRNAAMDARKTGDMAGFYKFSGQADQKAWELADLIEANKPKPKAKDSTGSYIGDIQRAMAMGTYAGPDRLAHGGRADAFRAKLLPSGLNGAGGLRGATVVRNKSEELLARIEQHMAAQRKIIEAQLGGD